MSGAMAPRWILKNAMRWPTSRMTSSPSFEPPWPPRTETRNGWRSRDRRAQDSLRRSTGSRPTRGEPAHEESIHSRVRFDAERRNVGLPEYSGMWDRQRASTLYPMAGLLASKYAAIARILKPWGSWQAACWGR